MRTEYSIKNSITSIISNIISLIFIFISRTIFIKILGIEYNGLNGLFSNILTVLNLFELGIGTAITYNLYKYISKNDKEYIKSLMLFYKKAYQKVAISILLVGLILLPFLKLIIKEVTIDINVYIIYILFLISTISTYILAYKRTLLFANQRNYIINIIHVIYLILLNTLQILILFLTKNYYLYLVIKIICILFENIIISIKTNKDYPYILEKDIKPLDDKVKKDIISRVKALFIHKTSNVITTGTDNVIISTFLGLTTVGLYTNYNYIITTITTLFKDFLKSTTASVGNLLTEKDYNKRYEVFKKIRFINFWVATTTSICLLLLIEPFITIWLGNKYLLDNKVLIVLVINYFQYMMRTTYTIFRESAGIWREDKYMPIVQITINIVTSIILLKLFGLIGIFIGTIISGLVLWLYSYPKFIFKKVINRDYIDYVKNIFTSIIVFFIVTSLTSIISKIVVIKIVTVKLLVNMLICIIVPNILLLLIYYKTDEFKYYCNLFKRFKKKRGVK